MVRMIRSYALYSSLSLCENALFDLSTAHNWRGIVLPCSSVTVRAVEKDLCDAADTVPGSCLGGSAILHRSCPDHRRDDEGTRLTGQ